MSINSLILHNPIQDYEPKKLPKCHIPSTKYITDINNISAAVELGSIEEGSTVFVLVKFQHNLDGVSLEPDFDLMCDNSEIVTAEIDPNSDFLIANAAIRITTLP